MSDTSEQYKNWVRSGLGLKYLKKGLETFAEEIVKDQHTCILDNIKQLKHLSSVNCGKCQTKCIQPDHIRTKTNQCPLGCKDCNCKYPRDKIPCDVCGAFYDQLIKFHGSTPPSPHWRNTNSSLWFTDPWEVAKCFINSPGYEHCTSAEDTDCAGLLHLIINNKAFHSHLDCSRSYLDTFSKARENRNKILHSAKMELEKEDTEKFIEDMIAVLQDPKELISRPEASEAVDNLTKLKTADFIITSENETEVLQERELRLKMEDAKSDLVDVIKRQADEAILAVRNAQATEQCGETQKPPDFSTSKKEFQERLVDLYMNNGFLTVSAAPLQPEKDNYAINAVYVQPWMTIQRKIRTRTTGQDGKDRVSERNIADNVLSFQELFSVGEEKMRLIYILGEAGAGKSSFCKDMVYTWCQAHSKENTGLLDNENEMKKFDFLFFISLRHNRQITDIKSMLFTQYEDSMLDHILKYESSRCLILLDGLDEWPLPPASRQDGCQVQTSGLPLRDLSKQYTVVTTSRPWKYERLNIRESEVHLVVRLRGIDDHSAERFSDLLINNLNQTHQTDKDVSEFLQLLHTNFTLKEFINVPVMLQQLLCLWFDGKDLKSSRCEIYSSMIELLFERECQRNFGDECKITTQETDEISCYNLPQNFDNKTKCQEYKNCIYLAGKIAYTTLFSECKELCLSFDQAVLKDIGGIDEVVRACLNAGILTEERCVSLSLSKPSKPSLSFIHKSIQEFLASVYIAVQCENVPTKAIKDCHEDQKGKDVERMSNCILEYLQSCRTVESILEQSNVMIILCGLVKSGCMQITKYILNATCLNDMVVEYRSSTQEYYTCRFVKEIQNLVTNCIREVNMQETCAPNLIQKIQVTVCSDDSTSQRREDVKQNKTFLLGDLIITNITDLNLLQDIKTDKVISLFYVTNRFNDTMRAGLKVQKLYILLAEIPDQDIEILSTLMMNSSSILKSISFEKNYYAPDESLYVSLYGTLIGCLNMMKQLVAIKVEGFKLSHQQCKTLAKFLNNNKKLCEIFIQDIHCKNGCCIEHTIKLPNHANLKKLSLNNTSIKIMNFNTSRLVMCDIGGTLQSFPPCLKNALQLEVLKFSSITSDDDFVTFSSQHQNLRHVMMEIVVMKPKAWDRFAGCLGELKTIELFQLDNSNITPEAMENVFDQLKSLSHLKRLYLGGVKVSSTDCFTFMLQLCHLENINLSCITMELKAWDAFMDCLLKVLRCVVVDTFKLKIESKDTITVRQYIKERRDEFRVKYEKDEFFDFEKT